jgi:hypothetical protein
VPLKDAGRVDCAWNGDPFDHEEGGISALFRPCHDRQHVRSIDPSPRVLGKRTTHVKLVGKRREDLTLLAKSGHIKVRGKRRRYIKLSGKLWADIKPLGDQTLLTTSGQIKALGKRRR